MKAVIYARYSSDNQREESIEGQLRECKEYAERNGILVLQSYIDRALSAKTDNRPEFQRMIRDSAKGLFDTVLVWKLDRFARNRYDSAHYKSLLRKNGVKVVSATESIADGPEGIILESMLEGMAEYYSAELAQKVNRGMRENALKARSNGGTIPLGYRLDEEHRLKIDPLTAPVVREVFQRYADGENLRTIIRSLNERGIRTSRNYPFRHSSFNTMLKNRKYIGEYHYKDVIIPDAVPPIISKELFERVQERMKKNQHAPARAKAEEEYLLTTKLFCGHCGRLMISESGKGRNGTIHRYYKCAGAKRRLGCHKKAVKKDWIERVAVQYTIQRVFQDDLIAQIADELVALQGAEDSALPLLRRQLADTERGIENMLNAIQQGIFTSSTRQRLEELENLRAELKSSILQAELERPQYSREDIIQWISRFKGGDPNDKAYQRQIIDIFLNSIYVFDDKLVFTYNYKNGSQTVSLADVFAAFGSDSRAGAAVKRNRNRIKGFHPMPAATAALHLPFGFFFSIPQPSDKCQPLSNFIYAKVNPRHSARPGDCATIETQDQPDRLFSPYGAAQERKTNHDFVRRASTSAPACRKATGGISQRKEPAPRAGMDAAQRLQRPAPHDPRGDRHL